MFVTSVALLSIFQIILAENGQIYYDSSQKQVEATSCNTELVNIQQQLDLLRRANENLNLKVDSLSTTLHQHHTMQQNESKKDLNELKLTLESKILDSQEQYLIKQSELQKDLGEIKLMLRTVPSSIISNSQEQHTIEKRKLKNKFADSKSILMSKIISDKRVQHIIERSELNNNMKVSKLGLKSVVSHINSGNRADSTMNQNRLRNDMEELKLKLLSKIIVENRAYCQRIQPSFTKNPDTNKSKLIDLIFPTTTETPTTTKKTTTSTTTSSTTSTTTPSTTSTTTSTTPKVITVDSYPHYTVKLQKVDGNGLCQIQILKSQRAPFDAYCLTDAANDDNNPSPWIVIQRREDGSVNFDRNWGDYQKGFGNLEGEFFIGLDKLHALTQATAHELWIEMETFNGTKHWAKYDRFAIAGASDDFALNVLGARTGNTKDRFIYSEGAKFTTKDVNNDVSYMALEGVNHAAGQKGGWWYDGPNTGLLNGRYLHPQDDKFYESGIIWSAVYARTFGSLKYVRMAIRAKL